MTEVFSTPDGMVVSYDELIPMVQVDRKLWLTEDGKRVVEDLDPEAASLWAGPGTWVRKSEAEKYGVTVGEVPDLSQPNYEKTSEDLAAEVESTPPPPEEGEEEEEEPEPEPQESTKQRRSASDKQAGQSKNK